MSTKGAVLAFLAVAALVAAAMYGCGRGAEAPAPAPTWPAPATTPRPARPAGETRAAGASAEDAPPAEDASIPPAATDEERAKWPIRVVTNVPGAAVVVQERLYGGEPDPPPIVKTTDARGFAGFMETARRAELARIELVVRLTGWATTRTYVDGPGDVTIELTRGVSMRGRVTDDAGVPVAGASIVAAGGAKWRGVEWVGTDDVGLFEVFVESAGPAPFRVQHEKFLPRDVVAAAPATGLSVVLERGFSVSGRVAFPDGKPLSGAAMFGARRFRRAVTDADGRYVLSGLDRGKAEIECGVTGEAKAIEAGATDGDFLVTVPVARIRFLDPRGRPFRFLAPSVRVRMGEETLYWSMSPGAGETDGVELVPGRPGATLVVSAHAAEGVTGGATTTFGAEPKLIDVAVVVGAPKATGTIRLIVRCDSGEIPRAVYAWVRDETGNKVAGDHRTRLALDAAGGVEIAGVPAGEVELHVDVAGYGSAEFLSTPLLEARPSAVVEAGRTVDVEALFVTGGRVRASLRDETGAALAPENLRLSSSDGKDVGEFVRPFADGGWTSELDATPAVLAEALPAGRYVLRATTKDDETVEREIEIRRGETIDVDLVAKPKR